MKREEVVRLLVTIDEEIGVAMELGDEERTRAAMAAHKAVSGLHVDGVDVVRMRRFNGSVGACGYTSRLGPTPASMHPDRCVCQGDDPTPHKHYDHAPHNCARCGKCESYEPAVKVSGEN